MTARTDALAALNGRPVEQVGILVRDLERAVEHYARRWAVTPWNVYAYGPDSVPRLSYRGEAGRFRMLVALSETSPQIELIHSIEGPSIYEEWLAENGEGLHHLGIVVPSLDAAKESFSAAGYELLQDGAGYGLDGDGGFAYFDTVRDFGSILEAIERPARRREPDAILT